MQDQNESHFKVGKRRKYSAHLILQCIDYFVTAVSVLHIQLVVFKLKFKQQ